MISQLNLNTYNNIDYVNKVLPPIHYKDSNNEVREFKKLENTLQINLVDILQGITIDADLKPIPSLKHFFADNAAFSILNFTKIDLIINKDRTLFANYKKLIDFTTDDCRIIAYHNLDNPDFICIEQKDDKEKLPEQRQFITIFFNQYKFISLKELWHYIGINIFESHIPFQIADAETFIKTNSCMSNLVKHIANEAALKKEPTLIQYKPQTKQPRFTILNHTDLAITINVLRDFLINNKKIINFSNDDCQMIIYHLQGHSEMICIEQQDESSKQAGPRVFLKLDFEFIKESECNINFAEDV